MQPPNDTRFITNSGLQDTDVAKIRQVILEVIGDPRLGNFLGDAFQRAFGQTMSSNINMFGGASMPYGSSALFGPRDAGAEMMAQQQDLGIQTAMASSAQTVSRLRREQAEKYLMTFGGAENEEQARAMAGRFTFTGMASNFMFNQLQPGGLQAGLEEGSRYLGAAAMGFDDRTLARQERAGTMADSLTEAFLSKPQDFYGLRGADVGRLYAEMGRTGQLGAIQRNAAEEAPGSELSETEIMQRDVLAATKEASRSIQAFRQIFKGSVTDVLDQVNALMGVDVMSTFDDQGRSLLQNMSAAGAVAGFAPQQMAALGGMSRQVSLQAGLDPWGAAAAATYSAQILGTQRQAGISSPLVNQVAFRNDVVRKTTGAQQSGMSRDISGAYALIEQSAGKESADEWLRNLRDMEPDALMNMDASEIARSTGIKGISGFDVRDASFTAEAEKARAMGVGTRVAARHNMASLQANRLAMIENALEMNNVEGREGIMNQLRSGPVTEDAMREAFGTNAEANALRGSLMRRFALQAKAAGFTGGARGVDQFLATTYETETTRRIMEDTETGRRFMETLGGRNVSGGIVGLNEYIKTMAGSSDPATVKGFVQSVLGGPGRNVDGTEVLEMFEGFERGSENLRSYFVDNPLGKEATARERANRQMAEMGANEAMKTLFQRTYRGKAATKEQIAAARDLIMNFRSGEDTETTTQDLIDYAEEATGGGFQWDMAKNVFDIDKALERSGKKMEDEDIQRAAESLTVMEQITADDVKFMSGGLRKDKAAQEMFKNTAQRLGEEYEESLRSGSGAPKSFEQFKREWSGWKASDTMDRKSFEKALEEESSANESIGAPGSTATGLGVIIELLKRIAAWFENGGGVSKPTKDATGDD